LDRVLCFFVQGQPWILLPMPPSSWNYKSVLVLS
jgi:hypothetical protein